MQDVRETVKELVFMRLSNELHSALDGAQKTYKNVVQLLQTYKQLAELELTAGKKPRPGDVCLPEGTKERISEWAEGGEAEVREREELVEQLSAAMQAHGHDPGSIWQVMGGGGGV
jgi:hypothetical protein